MNSKRTRITHLIITIVVVLAGLMVLPASSEPAGSEQEVSVSVSLGVGVTVPNVPCDVYIDHSTNLLMVNRPNDRPRPYIIKGVSWSPATRAPQNGSNLLDPQQQVPYGFFFDWSGRNPEGHELLQYWLTNELASNAQVDLPLISGMNANTVRIYNSLGSSLEDYSSVVDGISGVLDESYRNGLMVIMTIAISKNDLDTQKYLKVVDAFKNHPAILMWSLGNEWNMNDYYGYTTLDEAAAAVNQAALQVKQHDAHHPVSSILGDTFYSGWKISDVVRMCPQVDTWGINLYRGISLGPLFTQWADLWAVDLKQSAKPFFVSEFGIDSFSSDSGYTRGNSFPVQAFNVTGRVDEASQAEIDASLWGEIKGHLSALKSGELCLGGLIHEFNDELWRGGNYNISLGGIYNYNGPDGISGTADDDHSYDQYNADGFEAIGGSPDNVLNEEYFGLVNADRQPKPAYSTMKDAYILTSLSNHPPLLNVIGSKNIAAGQALNFTVSATDEDVGDTLDYSATGVPDGASFNNTTHAFSWTPQTAQIGDHIVVFVVSDGSATAEEAIFITVTQPAPTNHSPVLASIGNKTVVEGSALNFTVSATDADGDTLTYSATGVPDGASFITTTHAFSWTPSVGQAGSYNGTFSVSDGHGGTASETITITVTAASSN
ncbi:MAG: putative Ig domain-containing protein, partial [Candidatus Omnitrophica bacterium]|nr:putative Ig domain-containing protein [Candidatus Omnitrophota bacterium]